jgi:hypothetical protein
MVSQEKWDKAKNLIGDLWAVLENYNVRYEGDKIDHVTLNYKELEITWGPSVYDIQDDLSSFERFSLSIGRPPTRT